MKTASLKTAAEGGVGGLRADGLASPSVYRFLHGEESGPAIRQSHRRWKSTAPGPKSQQNVQIPFRIEEKASRSRIGSQPYLAFNYHAKCKILYADGVFPFCFEIIRVVESGGKREEDFGTGKPSKRFPGKGCRETPR